MQDRESLSELGEKAGYDGLMLFFIILPLFYGAMHFYCAPFRKRYIGKSQVLVCPIALVPLFYWQSIDICFLAGLVLLMNIYIAWYHIDSGDDYGNASDEDSEEEIEKQIDPSTWMETIAGMIGPVASGFDMSGMSMMQAQS